MKSLVLRGKELQGHAVPFCPSIVPIYSIVSIYALCCFFRLSILAWGRIRGPAWGITFVCKIPDKSLKCNLE